MKRLVTNALLVMLLSLLLFGCAPGAITPVQVYDGEGFAAGPYPASTRSGHFEQDGFFLGMGPAGLELAVAQGPWRGTLYGGYTGAAGRVSWSQGQVGASLDMAYNGYTRWLDVDTDGDSIPDTYVEVLTRTTGVALDVAYYLEVPTEVGSAYVGPRGRAYFACTQDESQPFRCDRYGVLPGGTMGINVPLSIFSDRITLGFEGSVFLVVPALTDRPEVSMFSPFALSLSYRF